jgi:hypothetical protein
MIQALPRMLSVDAGFMDAAAFLALKDPFYRSCNGKNYFNNERPHEAIGMKYPVDVYSPSSRPYEGLKDLEYPMHDMTITVTACGRICIGRRKI